MTIDLTRFGADEAARLEAAIGRAAADAPTGEAAARAICRTAYDALRAPGGERACVLVRCYTTHPYGGLPPSLQRFAKRALGMVAITPPEPTMRCLVLLATTGDEPAWNDRRASVGHQAIPLPSPHVVERAPMIAQLVREVGLEIGRVVRPAAGARTGAPDDALGVFHVEEAAGSPHIPAQAGFVDRYAVRSVIGAGGLLASGELFAAILFARVLVPASVADAFRLVAGTVRGALEAPGGAVFDAAAEG